MQGQLRIDKLFAFVVIDDDGTEGIPAFLAPGGTAMPMVGADLARVDSLRPIAQKFARESDKTVRLYVFDNRAEVEVIQP